MLDCRFALQKMNKEQLDNCTVNMMRSANLIPGTIHAKILSR